MGSFCTAAVPLFFFLQPHSLFSRVKSSLTEDERERLLQITVKYNMGATLLPIKSVGVQVIGHHTLRKMLRFKPWRNGPPNSSQLEPSFQLSWMELVIVWPPTWLELARVGSSWIELAWIWSSSNFRPTRAKFSTVWPPQPTLAKLFCYCYVTTRSYSDNWMVCGKPARLGGIVWPPADASFELVCNLARVCLSCEYRLARALERSM